MEFLFYFLSIIQIFFLLIVVYNYLSKITLKYDDKIYIDSNCKISILIPFRNEEKNVAGCLESLLKQELDNYEILCLDDNSEDKTYEFLKRYEQNYSQIKVISGKPLPTGWIGKNWACYQLASNAKGEYLIFLDADVRLNSQAINTALIYFQRSKVYMLSIFPTQLMKRISEYFITPSMNWLLLTFLPLNFVYKFENPSFVAANGQFIVVDKKVYFDLGGHEKIKDKVVEDMSLARLLKKNKYRISTFLGGEFIFARMYDDFSSAMKGFSKNFFAGFETTYLNFSIFLLFIIFSFLSPFVLIVFDIKFLLIIILIFVQKFLISLKSHQNVFINLILAPLQLLLMIGVGINSMLVTKRGNLTWKGRRIFI